MITFDTKIYGGSRSTVAYLSKGS